MILTSYTTFEEQNIPYPQKSSQNNENINKGLQLLKKLACVSVALQVARTHSLAYGPHQFPPPLPGLVPKSP